VTSAASQRNVCGILFFPQRMKLVTSLARIYMGAAMPVPCIMCGGAAVLVVAHIYVHTLQCVWTFLFFLKGMKLVTCLGRICMSAAMPVPCVMYGGAALLVVARIYVHVQS